MSGLGGAGVQHDVMLRTIAIEVEAGRSAKTQLNLNQF